MSDSEKLKIVIDIIERNYSKYDYNDDQNTSCGCDSYGRVFDAGVQTGQSRLAYEIAQEIGVTLEDPIPYDELH